jgi:hypothetical protein
MILSVNKTSLNSISHLIFARSEVSTAAGVKKAVDWVVELCNLAEV